MQTGRPCGQPVEDSGGTKGFEPSTFAYASRLLRVALSQCPGQDALGPEVRIQLTCADVSSRRAVWALAVMMGHASPRTTLQTYFHAGHEWLRDACPTFTLRPADTDAAEWFAFCCTTRRRSMQRAFQRVRGQERTALARRLWSRLPALGDGPRVDLASELPPLRLAEAAVRLTTVDRIIDHARRFNRVDGLAARLSLGEAMVGQVLAAAARFGADKRSSAADGSQWWIENQHARYSAHELRQVNAGLRRLEASNPDELAVLAAAIERCLVPASRMLAIESRPDLEASIRSLKRLVDDPALIQLLVPAKLPRRPAPEARRARDESARRQAALRHGVSIDVLHGRVPGARQDRHDRLRSSARFGLRIRENSSDRVRSAKVMTRILAAVAVACRALDAPLPR